MPKNNLSLDCRFLYLGTVRGRRDLSIPFPSYDSGLFETSRAVDAGRNALNTVVAQQVGRSVDKQNMSWNVMDCHKWWEINNWIEQNGMFFWCNYFAHNHGVWRWRRFYCGDISCQPWGIDPLTGMPKFYTNCKLNVIDMGE